MQLQIQWKMLGDMVSRCIIDKISSRSRFTGTSQMPLAGTVLCCTSIPPEQRVCSRPPPYNIETDVLFQTELAAIGSQMGATIKLDLTSDVTHLIVGNINSAKYRYVAKSREDVKVLSPEWLEALRTVWMEGGDVDVAALEKEYRLPTFYGLKICLTGFDNRMTLFEFLEQMLMEKQRINESTSKRQSSSTVRNTTAT